MKNDFFTEAQPPIKKQRFPSVSVIISSLILTTFGLLLAVFFQRSLINNQKAAIKDISQKIDYRPPTITIQPSPPITEKEPALFPNSSFISSEGTARIEDPYEYSFTNNKNFILILTLTSENILNETKTQWLTGKEYRYPIQLEGIVDSVTNPLIAFNHKYGCVTLQASGYVGSYVFNLDSGEGIFQGPQYSKCIEWIDQNRVLIAENLYNTSSLTYYILDTSTNKKTVLSTVELNVEK